MTEKEFMVAVNRTGTPTVMVPVSEVTDQQIEWWVMDDFEIHSGAHGAKEDPSQAIPLVEECRRERKHNSRD